MSLEDLNRLDETREVKESDQVQTELDQFNFSDELHYVADSLFQVSQLQLEELKREDLQTGQFTDRVFQWTSDALDSLSLCKEDFKAYPLFQTAVHIAELCQDLFSFRIENEDLGEHLLNLIGLSIVFVNQAEIYLKEGHLVDDLMKVGEHIINRLNEYRLHPN